MDTQERERAHRRHVAQQRQRAARRRQRDWLHEWTGVVALAAVVTTMAFVGATAMGADDDTAEASTAATVAQSTIATGSVDSDDWDADWSSSADVPAPGGGGFATSAGSDASSGGS